MQLTWVGNSGNRYEYEAYDRYASWNDVPGNYIFTRRAPDGYFYPLYIGQAGSLSNRLGPSHDKWDQALLRGMTHICAHINLGGEAARLREENDLISYYSPPLNAL